MSSPFGVRPDRPLDVVVHKGGYGDDYVVLAEDQYQRHFPEAKVTHTGVKDVAAVVAPRLSDGTPPDLISTAGANTLNIGELVHDGRFRELGPLLDAPGYDATGARLRDTLLPGTVDMGTYHEGCYALSYTYNVYGVFYNRELFDRHGWEFPRTWDRMIELCGRIHAAGVAPWTYGGNYLLPLLRALLMMAVKSAGARILTDIDDLRPGAWRDDAVVTAAEAMQELVQRGYVLPGTADMTYLQAQERFVRGEAAFIPCGSWLENEMRDVEGRHVDMAFAPVPAMTGSPAVPTEAVMAAPAESFVVPSAAHNPEGAFELLRIMTSTAKARRFTELTNALTSVVGAANDVLASRTLRSVRDTLAAAGPHTYYIRLHLWYPRLNLALGEQTARLMTGEITPRTWSDRCQDLADATAADDAIPKYHR